MQQDQRKKVGLLIRAWPVGSLSLFNSRCRSDGLGQFVLSSSAELLLLTGFILFLSL